MAPAIPAGKTFFDLEDFKRSFTDVPVDAAKNNAIGTKEFLEACESLCTIFKFLPSTFSLVDNDMKGNITKIKTRYDEAPAESATLQELVVNELKSKKHVATEGLLWLSRGLDFMYQALEKNVANKEEELSKSFNDAYGNTLKPHHSFVVKPLFAAAMKACPYRKDFYNNISGEGVTEAEVIPLMNPYVESLGKIVKIIGPFMNSKEAKW